MKKDTDQQNEGLAKSSVGQYDLQDMELELVGIQLQHVCLWILKPVNITVLCNVTGGE